MYSKKDYFVYNLNELKVPEYKQHDFEYVKRFFSTMPDVKIHYCDFNDSEYSFIVGVLLGDITFEFCFNIVDNIPLIYFREG